MAQTVQGNLDRPKGSENLVCHRRPQNSFSNLFWDTILVDEQFTWERVLDLVVYHQSNHVRCAPVHKHWPGRISAILYLNIEAVIRFNNTVGIVSKHNGLIYAFNVQKKIIWKKKVHEEVVMELLHFYWCYHMQSPTEFKETPRNLIRRKSLFWIGQTFLTLFNWTI